jgi:regulator of sirC expression with transglutaminase-like and TPR domain
MSARIIHLGLLEDEAITLDAAGLELAALDHPDLDLAPYGELLSAMTERLVSLADDAASADARARLLASVIGGEFGFSGDRDTYDDPQNVDLIRVIDRRRGLPVSLSILYVAAARRLGWTADALNTPGHVLTRIGSDTAPVLIDPFDGGAIVDPDRLAALMAGILGQHAVISAEHLAPMTNRSVLVRLLTNEATREEAMGDPARALVLYERMTVIAPFHSHGWWERARLELREGDTAAARGSLSAMLETTRDPAMRIHISAALDQLTR